MLYIELPLCSGEGTCKAQNLVASENSKFHQQLFGVHQALMEMYYTNKITLCIEFAGMIMKMQNRKICNHSDTQLHLFWRLVMSQ